MRGSVTIHRFFDETQGLPHQPLFIDRLTRCEKCEVTVAGSLPPSPDAETAGPLSGRIVSWDVFPLSFREFLDGKGIESDSLPENPVFTAPRRVTSEIFYSKTKTGREVDLVALLSSVPGNNDPAKAIHLRIAGDS